jgi:diacylglycerol kinase family enzyme
MVCIQCIGVNGTVPDAVRVLILYNPVSGAGRSHEMVNGLSRELERLAGASGVSLALETAETRPEPSDRWLDARLDAVELLVVVGGDGAMRLVAPSAVRRGVPVYHYPGGTENLFARDFDMRAEPRRLFEAITGGTVRAIDVARVEGAICLLCASLGLDAAIVDDLSSRRTGAISHRSYVLPMLRQLWQWRKSPPRFEVEVDGRSLGTQVSGLVLIANSSQYAARLDPAAAADNGDGLLDVVHLPARSFIGLLVWVLRCRRRRQLRARGARHLRGRTITIRSDRPTRAQVDGDALKGAGLVRSLTAVIEPGALRVLVPPVRESTAPAG